MRPHVDTLRAKTLTFIESCGANGATRDECEDGTGMLCQTLCARIRELVLGQFVADSGRRRPSRTGRPATVYVAVSVRA